MNRQLLGFSLVLIVIGLLGVSTVQTLWLKAAVENRKADFDQRVYESMEEIAYNIEHIGYQPYIKEFIELLHSDSLSDIQFQRWIRRDSTNQEHLRAHHDFDSVEVTELSRREFNRIYRAQIKEFQELLIREMITLRPIEEVVDLEKLTSLIEEVLNHHGLKIKFEFAITEFADNNFIYVSPGADISKLFHTEYTTKLFRRSIFDENKLLKITFPEKKKFFVLSFLMPILSSILFLFMIVVAFLVSYRIIFSQKKLSDMKTDFINNMTHELKTPIATISIASEMLKDSTISSIDSNRLKYANIIFEENKRLSNHVEQVLQIARLEKGEVQLNKEERDIHGIILSIISHFKLIIDDYGAVIETKFQAEDTIYRVDEMHITNAIRNLLSNALKYNDKKPYIVIRTYNSIDKGINISVQDNGIGLSKDSQKKIFDKFYRVHGGNVHKTKGFGLGLNYVKTVILAHNGTINVESKLNEGTTFIIYIPKNNKL